MAEKKGVFISHIAEERKVAWILKKYIQDAFGPYLPVFVASDETSIGGGRKWFNYIVKNLRTAKVVLVLVSKESSTREWLNFEAGFGDGAAGTDDDENGPVIPISINKFSLGNLRFPLGGFNGRTIYQLDGILSDISRETGLTPVRVDIAQFVEDIGKAESSLIYKSLLFSPYVSCKAKDMAPTLHFEMCNQGNADLDLLYAEAIVPRILCDQHWVPLYQRDNPPASAAVITEFELECWNIKHYSMSQSPDRLEPVLARSMGTRSLSQLKCVLTRERIDPQIRIKYQIFARNYDTEPQIISCGEIERR